MVTGKDCRSLNIRDTDGQCLCPVCGLPGYFKGDSFSDHGPLIGTGICPCCFYEPGFDDESAAGATTAETVEQAVIAYRQAWIEAGSPWLGRDDYWFGRPHSWNPASQLAHLAALAPQLCP